jgi:Bacterial PH domain
VGGADANTALMPDVYAFEPCPFRDVSHAVADRSSIVRHAARALWPSARRAERVEISDDGIEAWTLVGQTQLAWSDIKDIRSERTLLGRKTLRISGASGRIDVAPVLPGYEELERQVRAGRPVAVAA